MSSLSAQTDSDGSFETPKKPFLVVDFSDISSDSTIYLSDGISDNDGSPTPRAFKTDPLATEVDDSPIIALASKLSKRLVVESESDSDDGPLSPGQGVAVEDAESDSDSPIVAKTRKPTIVLDNTEDEDSDDDIRIKHRTPRVINLVSSDSDTDTPSRTYNDDSDHEEENIKPHVSYGGFDKMPPICKTPPLQVSEIAPSTPRTIFKTPLSHVHSKLSLRVRQEMTTTLFQEFNDQVFQNSLPSNLKIEWSARLNKTAGKANCQRSLNVITGNYTTSYTITLASKVTDTEHKLRNTLAHELCHIAVFHRYGLNQPPHGQAFRKYADQFERVYTKSKFGADLAIIVDTCHSYDIDYKFKYICVNEACKMEYGRHSKSIDTDKKVCGKCKSRLMLHSRDNQPISPGTPKLRKDGTPAKPNPFTEFVKENFAQTRQQLLNDGLEKVSHKEIMSELGSRWKKRAATT